MLGWQVPAATLAAYAIGCVAWAYYIVRALKGQDIRELGSGNVGGRNAGRVLGRAGFAAVAVLDALKGAAAVLLAGALGVAGWGLLPVLFAVVAGHIWPAQLHFRGGKGIATMVGALLFYDYLIPLILLGMVVLLFAVLRSITLAFVIALALLPLVLLVAGWPWPAIASVVALAVIVLYAHRANIRARLQRRAGSPAS